MSINEIISTLEELAIRVKSLEVKLAAMTVNKGGTEA